MFTPRHPAGRTAQLAITRFFPPLLLSAPPCLAIEPPPGLVPTHLVADLRPGSAASLPLPFPVAGGLVVAAREDSGYRSLWRIDPASFAASRYPGDFTRCAPPARSLVPRRGPGSSWWRWTRRRRGARRRRSPAVDRHARRRLAALQRPRPRSKALAERRHCRRHPRALRPPARLAPAFLHRSSVFLRRASPRPCGRGRQGFFPGFQQWPVVLGHRAALGAEGPQEPPQLLGDSVPQYSPLLPVSGGRAIFYRFVADGSSRPFISDGTLEGTHRLLESLIDPRLPWREAGCRSAFFTRWPKAPALGASDFGLPKEPTSPVRLARDQRVLRPWATSSISCLAMRTGTSTLAHRRLGGGNPALGFAGLDRRASPARRRPADRLRRG